MSKELVNDTIISLIDFLPKVIKATRDTAELFHTDHEVTALENMVEIIDAYTWIIDAIDGIKKNGFLTQLNLEKMTNFLHEIEKSMIIQDFVAISDLMEFEIVDILELWLADLKGNKQ
jgi:hypothetical protein